MNKSRSPRSRTTFTNIAGVASVALILTVLFEMSLLNFAVFKSQEPQQRPQLEQQNIRSVLEYLLDTLEEGGNGSSSSRQISFAFSLRHAVARDDITLATHVSINKLFVLLHQIKRWNGGPVSCAVNLQSKDDVDKLVNFVRTNQAKLGSTSFHVRLEKNQQQDYPVNHLRNLALSNVESDYLFTLDVDLVPDALAYTYLKSALQTDPNFVDKLHKKTLFVLPAFEHLVPSADTRDAESAVIKNRYVATKSEMPANKDELLSMIHKGDVGVFWEDFYPGHGPSNYTKWYQDVPDEFSYPIDYEFKYEPYVLAYRHGLPRYWPYFRGFFSNKLSWFVELHYAGYTFEVIRDHFCIHRNHPRGDQILKQRTLKQWFAFKQYVIERYNAPKEELKDWTDKKYGDAKWQKYMSG